jgi:hypothetical protein
MPPAAVLEDEPRAKEGDRPAGPTIEIVDEPQRSTGPSVEEALAASRRATEQAEAAQRAAQQRDQQSQAELQRMRQSQTQDQAAVLASAVEASTAERDKHAHAWQAAMEAGEFAAAAKHMADSQLATAKLDRASGELAMLKAGQQQRQAPQQPQRTQDSLSPAVQDWIARHKEFSKPGATRDSLLAKHQELINDGVQSESPRYFRELDAEYERLTAGSGDGDGGHRDMDRGQGRQFDGAPPSRGGGGSAGDGGRASGTVQTLLGPVGVRTSGGQTYLNIPAHLRADFAEGAKVTGMSVEEYAMDQVKIARERDAGGTGGLISQEGAKYR